ncbi:hypothetical protein [Streptomyces fulvoviolaceus]|uniref:hypothetical protein n=1 Tax=Streptomyces fulvoviolaceus TaxID=285535 RepID=UPI0021C1FF59|nr:hypothetical protein [Streptomyces fulvoviolaceus]MCT9076187.1 hypothetical protein [Streptomyces fulvoviolaceus]
MHRPTEDVRILEVPQFPSVPAAGAVLVKWGAGAIKIKHSEFAEHTDEALHEFGLSDEEFVPSKIDGAAICRPAGPVPTNPLPIARVG